MPYSFEYRYEKQDFIDLNRVFVRAKRPFVYWMNRVTKVVGFCVGLFALATAVLLLALGGGFDMTVGIMLVLGGYLVTQPFFKWSDKLSGSISRQITMHAESVVHIDFEDAVIRDHVEGIETTYPYTAIIDLMRFEDRYFLYVDKNKAIILPRRGIVDGDFEAIGPWLEEKIGKPLQILKKV